MSQIYKITIGKKDGLSQCFNIACNNEDDAYLYTFRKFGHSIIKYLKKVMKICNENKRFKSLEKIFELKNGNDIFNNFDIDDIKDCFGVINFDGKYFCNILKLEIFDCNCEKGLNNFIKSQTFSFFN